MFKQTWLGTIFIKATRFYCFAQLCAPSCIYNQIIIMLYACDALRILLRAAARCMSAHVDWVCVYFFFAQTISRVLQANCDMWAEMGRCRGAHGNERSFSNSSLVPSANWICKWVFNCVQRILQVLSVYSLCICVCVSVCVSATQSCYQRKRL